VSGRSLRVLYKYTGPIGLRCLQTLQIKITPPHHLNDPFEFYPRIDGIYTDAEIEEDLEDPEVRSMVWEALKGEGILDFSFPDFEDNFADNKAEVMRYISETWPFKTELSARDSGRFFGLHFGIYCLSENCTNPLMWSHYADSHKGLVLGIDTDLLCDSRREPMKVKYSSDRAPLNHRFNRDPDRYKELLIALITTKSLHWSYEQEYRILFRLEECSQGQRQDGNPIYLFSIDPKTITRVILGSRVSRQTAALVVKELRKPHFSHIMIDQAMLHNDKFEVELHAISLEDLEGQLSGIAQPRNVFFPNISDDGTLAT
jgi:hypothetical protein